MKSNSVLAAVAVVSIAGHSVHAAAIYGGPTYDSNLDQGYTSPLLSVDPGSTAGNGTAVGYADKVTAQRDVGVRAIRWGTTGTASELGNLGTDSGGYTINMAYAVNPTGTAVGYAYKFVAGKQRGSRAVRWDATGTAATELGNLGTTSDGTTASRAHAISISGTAVGYANRYSASTLLGTRAVRWDANGTAATELTAAGLGTAANGSTNVYAQAIADSGMTVGNGDKWFSNGTSAGTAAIRWSPGATAGVELGALSVSPSGNSYSYAKAVNDAGTVVGYASKFIAGAGEISTYRAVRWDAAGTAATELGNLGTDRNGGGFSFAYDVNAAGTAVGFSEKFNAVGNKTGSRAVRWDATGTAATELRNPDPASKTDSVAFAINAAGNTVGYAYKFNASTQTVTQAVAWTADNAIDLNTLLPAADAAKWTLTEADGISDTNWISGIGSYDPDATGPLTAYNRAFLIKLAYVGDADGDDDADFNDFLTLQNHFGEVKTATAFSPADFNYDGVTDFNDFLILQNHFGTSLSGSSVAFNREQVAALHAFGTTVPEPASLVVGIFGGLLLGRRRHVST